MIERFGPARVLLWVAAVALLTACAAVTGSPSPVSRSAGPSRPPVTASSPSPPSPQPSALPTGGPDQISAVIAAQVPSDWPRLLPSWFPAPMVARATVTADGYQVTYGDDLHTREVTFSAGMGVNPPGPTSDATSGIRQFRGVRANYVVYQPAVATSQRYLHWLEPGTWPRPANGMALNDMFLMTSGLTEAEFFGVAESVAPLR